MYETKPKPRKARKFLYVYKMLKGTKNIHI